MTKGWHSADIIAGLRKKGTSLAALSRECGLASSTLANALTRPWPKGEFLIAKALEVHPSEIWPERYVGADGEIVDRERFMRRNRELARST
ncbi:helix-turn-helix transcriptional regulator [Cedecea neteri]|uniref:helix-turn-helix domain-containing protein n=1 Tax=Cedecea neteri TaxID=158822 RepID=UPI002892C78E|nr:helix-turn-helix transcriptional regulator [Cedecea neteri]WNJ80125.1 helix-turn-helix transcriptional regulator [Cedecea neteri]